MKTYEVGLKIDGELSVQTLEEKRLSASAPAKAGLMTFIL